MFNKVIEIHYLFNVGTLEMKLGYYKYIPINNNKQLL